MQFRFLRLLDQVIGKILLLVISPLCGCIARWIPATHSETEPQTITILKLHGGGSLLIAMPALLGLRAKYAQAKFTLVGTPETQKYAVLTGIFDHYTIINASSLPMLLVTGIKALIASFRQDVFLDLEPHSTLAAVFCPLTFAARRIGFVKAHEHYRASSYTGAIYFNTLAPIYVYYEQMAAVLEAPPAPVKICQSTLKAQRDTNDPILFSDHPRPAIYASAFVSGLASERMLPTAQWIERLHKKFGANPFTLILGGGTTEVERAKDMAKQIVLALPAVRIINACGKRSLEQSMSDIDSSDEFWGVDSGPLHIARLLGKQTESFWGPTNPAYRLNTVPDLIETVHYINLPCSPCVHLTSTPPCKGDNQCMKQLFNADIIAPIWRL